MVSVKFYGFCNSEEITTTTGMRRYRKIINNDMHRKPSKRHDLMFYCPYTTAMQIPTDNKPQFVIH